MSPPIEAVILFGKLWKIGLLFILAFDHTDYIKCIVNKFGLIKERCQSK